MPESDNTFVFVAFSVFVVVVAFAGYKIITTFAGTISNMQNSTEAQWSREAAAEQAKIESERNRAAGGV